MKTLVTMGRGGSGKTSFVALMTKYFIEMKDTPILLVDADPDQNLGEMVGVELEETGKDTISELLMETFLERGGTIVGVPPSERIESKIWAEGMYEGDYFDLISIGTKWIEGCYCLPNAALKAALKSLTRNYRYVVIDSPAGLEHLNRRITAKIDDIFDVIDPSRKSFEHVNRAHHIAQEVEIEFTHFYVIGGFRFAKSLEDQARKAIQQEYLGKISYDESVEQYNLLGKSLLDLPSDSAAYDSVRRIMKTAGYIGQ